VVPPRPDVDGVRNKWNTAPACVLGTVWGTASIPDLPVQVGAVPANPTGCHRTFVHIDRAAHGTLLICVQRKGVAH